MKRLLFIAAMLVCMTACDKPEKKREPEPVKKEARLVLEWKQSDNIKAYTDPLVAYRINGGDVVVEVPCSKSIDLPFEGGKVEIAFLSRETSKDPATLISEAKAGEEVSYYYYAAVIMDYGDSETKDGLSFNTTPLSKSRIKDDEGKPNFDADDLKMIIFDEFNRGSEFDPSDGKTFKYRRATGKERKLVFTWEGGDSPKITDSYETGNLFPQP